LRFIQVLSFNIAQSSKDLALMEKIQDFFNNLGKTVNGQDFNDVAKLRLSHNKDMAYLTINRLDFITNVLIPLFDALIWRTKKEKDYKDWKTI